MSRGREQSAGFSSLREILDRSPALAVVRQHSRTAELRAAWSAAVGEKVAARTRVQELRGGKLRVAVSSAPLLQELSAFRRREIVAKLKAQPGLENLIDITFKQG